MSLEHPEDQMTREGLIIRFYNAYSANVKTKEQALDLISEIAQAVDGTRKVVPSKPKESKEAGKKLANALPK